MKDFTARDYILSGLIILGVLAAWFILIAALMGIVGYQLSMAIIGILSLIVYIIIKRRKPN